MRHQAVHNGSSTDPDAGDPLTVVMISGVEVLFFECEIDLRPDYHKLNSRNYIPPKWLRASIFRFFHSIYIIFNYV